MGLLNSIKNKVESLYNDEAAKMQICMLGARGVGKTSVLTSMFHDLNETNSKTNLMIKANDSADNGWTRKAVIDKFNELQNAFYGAKDNIFLTNAGISGDYEIHTYRFQFGVKGKKQTINLDVRDYPGEKVDTEPEMVKQYIKDSNAVIIAIDSPHLMEESGLFNEAKNRTKKITTFFKTTLADLDEDKLILLVPLKCEKYRAENRMDELSEKVEETYFELLEYLKTFSGKKHIACAITPIFTLGEVVFDSFEKDDNGEIKLIEDPEGNLPIAKYRFISPRATYKSQYCEQPLCYLLSFVTRLYYRTKDEKVGIVKKFLNIFKLFPDDPTLLMEVDRFASKKVTAKDGYKIIHGQRKV